MKKFIAVLVLGLVSTSASAFWKYPAGGGIFNCYDPQQIKERYNANGNLVYWCPVEGWEPVVVKYGGRIVQKTCYKTACNN